MSQIAEYRYADTQATHYEEDHLIPLELGGHPTDPKNLWPEPLTPILGSDLQGELGPVTPATKNRFEAYLQRQVCAGAETLAQARRDIAADWIAAWLNAGRP